MPTTDGYYFSSGLAVLLTVIFLILSIPLLLLMPWNSVTSHHFLFLFITVPVCYSFRTTVFSTTTLSWTVSLGFSKNLTDKAISLHQTLPISCTEDYKWFSNTCWEYYESFSRRTVTCLSAVCTARHNSPRSPLVGIAGMRWESLVRCSTACQQIWKERHRTQYSWGCQSWRALIVTPRHFWNRGDSLAWRFCGSCNASGRIITRRGDHSWQRQRVTLWKCFIFFVMLMDESDWMQK